MEISTEKMMTDEALSDDPQTILKPRVEETGGDNDLGLVGVTTTVVEKNEVSVVNMVQEEKGEHNEMTENEIEGLFGNLGNEDESLKVKNSENGGSVDMDVEGALVGESRSDINAIFEEEKDGENRSDVNALFEEKTGVDPMDVFEFKEDVNNDEENVGDDNGEAENEDHGFVVGDFVWGKIKSHPWWPGQIYDPNDASDYAASMKGEGEGQLLVAYFGDRSFSWCSPSQLKPFIDNFEKMSSQSDSKRFVNAVQEALEEVRRRVEGELKRKCQTVNVVENTRVVNRGIKKGACAPKGNTVKVLIDRIDPVELVLTLNGYATMEPGKRLVDLELAVLKSCLSAFYAKKGGFLLVEYRDPMCIEGLEEVKRSGVVGDSDVNGPMGTSENGDKLYQKRKQKSVAELMGEEESKIKKAKASKDGGTKEKKRKLEVSVTPEPDHECSGGGGGGGIEEETMSPRQRKKSRFLSPPYLSPIGLGSGKLSLLGSGSFKEPKPEAEKDTEMGAQQLDESLKSSGKKARGREESDVQDHKKMDAAVSVAKVLDGLLHAAFDTSSCLQNEESLPTVIKLVSSFRSSNFKEGSCKQTVKKKDNLKEGSSKQTGKKKEKDGGILKERSCKQTGKKKDGEDRDTSELAWIKQKLELMSEMVQKCDESEMSADVKGRLGEGLQEVLEKVVKLRVKSV